jgi:nucleotide-binding universal stress UspA family protein
MFEKILVLTDFSAYAHKFLESIGDLPDTREVVILNVVSRDPRAKSWDPVAKAKEAETKLAREKKRIDAPGVNVTVRAISATEGDIAMQIPAAIQRVASEENVSLVVMGARGKSYVQSILLGSLTRNLLRSGDRHLLIMRYRSAAARGSLSAGDKGASLAVAEPPKGPEMLEKFGTALLSKVLIPTDFSQPAEAVVSSIAAMLGLGEIILLHVVSRGESKEEIEIAVNDASKKLKAVSHELGKKGVKATPTVVIGSPMEEIRSMADKEDVSLIAMSSVGESAFSVGKIGSITYDVASTANRPVLVVRLKMTYSFNG